MANWREILISGSDGVLQSLKTDNSIQVSGSIHLSQSIHDTNDNTGTLGQVLSSTVSGSLWVDAQSGPQGAQGPIGEKGGLGAQGVTGAQGATGTQGNQGNQGAQGATGGSGPQGAQGANGPQGNPGNQGAQGADGPQGDVGAQGAIGTGAQGAQGNPGSGGAQGAAGGSGAQGTAGSILINNDVANLIPKLGGNGAITGSNTLKETFNSGSILESIGDVLISGSLNVGFSALQNRTKGRISAANDVVAFATSDINYKENVIEIPNALDKIDKIRGVEFDWISLTDEEKVDHHSNEGHDVGVIAQEIEKVLPEIVTERENGSKAVRYEKIVALLIQAIKEQQIQINQLKTKS